ncbi:MAG: hypothetical protein IT371_27610 [Deltaproteobacteria bacterium]|nr:hypothetical protein [Deltaproteobacteria bacterium]
MRRARPHRWTCTLSMSALALLLGPAAPAALARAPDRAPRAVLELATELRAAPRGTTLRRTDPQGAVLLAWAMGLAWSRSGTERSFDTLLGVRRTTPQGMQATYTFVDEPGQAPRLQLAAFEHHTPTRLRFWGAGESSNTTKVRTRDGRDLVKIVRHAQGLWVSTVLADPQTGAGVQYRPDPERPGHQLVRPLERAIPIGLLLTYPEFFGRRD